MKVPMPTRTKVPATETALDAAKAKFCYQHQGWVSSDAGGTVIRGKVIRWICFACQEKSRNAKATHGKSI